MNKRERAICWEIYEQNKKRIYYFLLKQCKWLDEDDIHDVMQEVWKALSENIHEMCTFLLLNISSLQLIPVNVIAYRSQYGSVNPAAIVGPGIVATAVSTAVAVVFCKVMESKRK